MFASALRRAVVERPVNPTPFFGTSIGTIPSNKQVGALICHAVEHRVVSRTQGPAQTCLFGSPAIVPSKLAGLLNEIKRLQAVYPQLRTFR
jgi:hypothetical protein